MSSATSNRPVAPSVAPNVGPADYDALDFERLRADTDSGRVEEKLAARSGNIHMSFAPSRSSKALSEHRVGAVLVDKFDLVLSEMPHAHGWAGAPHQVMEDALSDTVEAVLRQHRDTPYTDENVVAGALRAGVKLRAKQYWWRKRERKSGQDHVELTADTAGLPAVIDDHDATVDALSAAALMPFARDCLAELTERQAQIIRLQAEDVGVRTIAKAFGLERKDIQRELRYAEKAISQFAMVLEAGRVCGKRAPAIAAYADGAASPDDVRRAEAHLDVCPQCHAAFVKTKSALGAQVAALVPLPALVVAGGHGRFGAIFARLGELVGGHGSGRGEALRETALGVFVRNPGSTEALTGAGLGGAGIAVGAKAAIGLCVAALAGGSAVCSSLGVLPDGLNIRHPDKPKVAKAKPKPKPKTAATAPTTASTTSSFTAPTPAPTLSATTSTRPSASVASAAARAARERRQRAARAKAARKRAVAARAAATNPLQSSSPTGTTSSTAAPAASAPPPAPPVQAPAPSPTPTPSSATASPALTGSAGGFENGTP
jgi:hypothetical protein